MLFRRPARCQRFGDRLAGGLPANVRCGLSGIGLAWLLLAIVSGQPWLALLSLPWLLLGTARESS